MQMLLVQSSVLTCLNLYWRCIKVIMINVYIDINKWSVTIINCEIIS